MKRSVLSALWSKMKGVFATQASVEEALGAKLSLEVVDELPDVAAADVRTVYRTGGVRERTISGIDGQPGGFEGHLVLGIDESVEYVAEESATGYSFPDVVNGVLVLKGDRIVSDNEDAEDAAYLVVRAVGEDVVIRRVELQLAVVGDVVYYRGENPNVRYVWEELETVDGRVVWEGRAACALFSPGAGCQVRISDVRVTYEKSVGEVKDYVLRGGVFEEVSAEGHGRLEVCTCSHGLLLRGHESWGEDYVAVLLRMRRGCSGKGWVPVSYREKDGGGQLIVENALSVDEGGLLSVPRLVTPTCMAFGDEYYSLLGDDVEGEDIRRCLRLVNGADAETGRFSEKDSGMASAFVCDYPVNKFERGDWHNGYGLHGLSDESDYRVFWGRSKTVWGENEEAYKERHFGFGVQMVHREEVDAYLRSHVLPSRASEVARFEVVSQGVRDVHERAYVRPVPENKRERYRFSVR